MAGAALRLEATGPDFWNSKPASEWNTGDIYQLANHSPWATSVEAWGHNRLMGSVDASRGGPIASVPAPPMERGPKGVITWESAEPLRQALKHPLPRIFSNSYVIGVDGIPLGYTRDLEYVRFSTFLRSRGKVKWSVRPWVVRELIRNSVVYAFGFRKSSAPIDSESTLYFEAQFGRWTVGARFRPKEMLYRGELAL